MSSTSRRRELIRSRSLCASCGSPLTRSRKPRRPISSTSRSEAAITVALRGRPSSTPISPKNSPSLRGAEPDRVGTDLADDVDRAGADQDHVVARVALAEQDVAGLETLEQVHRLPDRRHQVLQSARSRGIVQLPCRSGRPPPATGSLTEGAASSQTKIAPSIFPELFRIKEPGEWTGHGDRHRLR